MDRASALLKETERPMLITSPEAVFYYSGFTGEGFLLIAEDCRLVYTDPRYTLQAKKEAPEFEVIDRDVLRHLKEAVRERSIHEVGIEEYHMTVANLARFTGFLRFTPAGRAIRRMRQRKTGEELKKIAAAQALSEAAFAYFLEHAALGMTEVQAASLIEGYMRSGGAQKTSFDTIVASGVRGAMPHALASKEPIALGSMVVCDFGCVLDNYCSDMTRTVAFGAVSEREREVYETVRRAQQSALEAARGGILAGEVDRAARDVIESAGYGEFFTHSTGHGVGLEVHEAPYAKSGSDELLEDGMTLTIEPGIYLPGEFGVRIEDLTVLTMSGHINFNRASKELTVIS